MFVFSRGDVLVDLVLENRIDLAPLRSTDMEQLALCPSTRVCVVHSFGLRQVFVKEGTFKARVLADDEEFPVPDDIDISDIEVPVGTGYTRLCWRAPSPLSVSSRSFVDVLELCPPHRLLRCPP